MATSPSFEIHILTVNGANQFEGKSVTDEQHANKALKP